jgi:hypothetical protein
MATDFVTFEQEAAAAFDLCEALDRYGRVVERRGGPVRDEFVPLVQLVQKIEKRLAAAYGRPMPVRPQLSLVRGGK